MRCAGTRISQTVWADIVEGGVVLDRTEAVASSWRIGAGRVSVTDTLSRPVSSSTLPVEVTCAALVTPGVIDKGCGFWPPQLERLAAFSRPTFLIAEEEQACCARIESRWAVRQCRRKLLELEYVFEHSGHDNLTGRWCGEAEERFPVPITEDAMEIPESTSTLDGYRGTVETEEALTVSIAEDAKEIPEYTSSLDA